MIKKNIKDNFATSFEEREEEIDQLVLQCKEAIEVVAC